MKRAEDFLEIYLYRETFDFRRGKEAMIAVVEGAMKKAALSGALFGFTNRKRDRIRLLYWDKSGFAQWSKVLEKERFAWPTRGGERAITLSSRELSWLLDGVDVDRLKPHDSLHYALTS